MLINNQTFQELIFLALNNLDIISELVISLYVCQFCDKKLGSKRTVRLHKVDPDNPIRYHIILVSPRLVTNLLKSVGNKTQRTLKLINQNVEL